jgi:hypothetical protein
MNRPRITVPDPDFSDAVVKALVQYRDGNRLRDSQVADLLGISKPTFSKYLSRAIQIGGSVLARAFVVLEIEVAYRGKVISARDFPARLPFQEGLHKQISFEFEKPCLLKETDRGLAVTVERKGSASETVIATIKIAG